MTENGKKKHKPNVVDELGENGAGTYKGEALDPKNRKVIEAAGHDPERIDEVVKMGDAFLERVIKEKGWTPPDVLMFASNIMLYVLSNQAPSRKVAIDAFKGLAKGIVQGLQDTTYGNEREED